MTRAQQTISLALLVSSVRTKKEAPCPPQPKSIETAFASANIYLFLSDIALPRPVPRAHSSTAVDSGADPARRTFNRPILTVRKINHVLTLELVSYPSGLSSPSAPFSSSVSVSVSSPSTTSPRRTRSSWRRLTWPRRTCGRWVLMSTKCDLGRRTI